MTVKEKLCPRCDVVKQAEEFYKRKSNKTGLRSWCKRCEIGNVAKYQKTDAGKAAKKRYDQSEKGVLNQKRSDQSEKGIARHARYNSSEKGKEYYKKARELNPDKTKARNTVNNAIKAGKIPHARTLACEFCGQQAEEYHHYKGYGDEHKLDIKPACIQCHRDTDNGKL